MSNYGCAGTSISTVPQCVYNCTRWTQINRGEPVRIYHDDSTWRQFYLNAMDADPLNYFLEAMNAWNSATSITLFEHVTNPALQQYTMRYVDEDPNDPCVAIGLANCLCPPEDDPCAPPIYDNSLFFAPNGPTGFLELIFVECVKNLYSRNQIVNVIAHELGHVLSHGHVYNTLDASGNPVDSLMGVKADLEVIGPTAYDIEYLLMQHPENCTGTDSGQALSVASALHDTRNCPGCQVARS